MYEVIITVARQSDAFDKDFLAKVSEIGSIVAVAANGNVDQAPHDTISLSTTAKAVNQRRTIFLIDSMNPGNDAIQTVNLPYITHQVAIAKIFTVLAAAHLESLPRTNRIPTPVSNDFDPKRFLEELRQNFRVVKSVIILKPAKEFNLMLNEEISITKIKETWGRIYSKRKYQPKI